MRTNLSTYLRDSHKELRKRIIDEITQILIANDNKLKLDDHQGDLIYQSIDDQENEMIFSAELITYPDNTPSPCVVVWIGVWEEDNSLGINDLGTDQLLNVLEACERAIE